MVSPTTYSPAGIHSLGFDASTLSSSESERPARRRDFQQVLADCYAKIHEIEVQMQGTHHPD